MASPKNKNTPVTQSDSFEMIELAIDDLSVLKRAFDVINEVCRGPESDIPDNENSSVEEPKFWLN